MLRQNNRLSLLSVTLLLCLFQAAKVAYGSDSWSNFSPLLAIIVYAAMMFRVTYKIGWITFIVSFFSITILGRIQYDLPWWSLTDSFVLFIYSIIFTCIYYSKPAYKITNLFYAGTLTAIAFYLATNSYCFFANPVYPKNLTGFYQALWSGSEASSLPTWLFFKNSLLSTWLSLTIIYIYNYIVSYGLQLCLPAKSKQLI